MVRLTPTGINVDKAFPSALYKDIYKVITKQKERNEIGWSEYSIAWNALSYRYLSLIKYYKSYSVLIKKYGNSPKPEIRAKQEQVIFNFFVTGFSLLDVSAYSTYAICSLIKPSNFPYSNNIRPNITLPMVIDKLKAYFKEEKVSNYFKRLVESQEYKEWRDIRNILMHRGQPGRRYYLGGTKDKLVEWINGINLNEDTLTGKLTWVNIALTEFMYCLKELLLQSRP